MSPTPQRSLSLPAEVLAPDTVSTLELLHLAERLAAGLALALLSPLLLFVAATIFALSARSPFVRHRRVGRYGAPLPMLKFRTMWTGNTPRHYRLIEDVSDAIPSTKSTEDDRVTSAFAAFCRRYSLDELPQLWHVLRGEMSFVGPRPITALEIAEHYGPAAAEVLSVRPGLAGLWQTMGRNKLTYPQRRRLDLLYARRASAALYFQTLWRAVPAVLRGTGAC